MELSRKALKIVTSAFDDLGVPYLRPDAGLFLYTDLRKVCCRYCFSGLFVYTDLRKVCCCYCSSGLFVGIYG